MPESVQHLAESLRLYTISVWYKAGKKKVQTERKKRKGRPN